ncbi:hypothetical protein [Aporhodopirellula aestuarii]|uniref:Uncharacterized protein n=1 Tax=Aporhodopirellula aestuarii TaxID=2950107 RepID=A0ABT0TXB7_9BACT|nr:hypothetical protein [Aporhodopirellula aestuarii]MCM2369258.1 hypothetical protein [Aporhodopirellula aestuarii]
MTNTTHHRNPQFAVRTECLYACVGLAIVSLLHRDSLFAMDPAKWATVSGWALLIVGIVIAGQLRDRFEQMLRRLHNREAIVASQIEFDQLLVRIHHRAQKAASIGSVLFPAILLIAYACVYAGQRWFAMPTLDRAVFMGEVILEAIAARFVGRYVGRGISYGFLGKHLASECVKLKVIPGHSDSAAGLRPIGDFYFHQATVTALPVAFLAFWVLVIPTWSTIWPSTESEFALQWKNTYLVFFFFTLGIEVLAFVLPLWFVHQLMAAQKTSLQSRVDELSAKLSKLQQAPTASGQNPDDGTDRALLIDQIASLENLPTWALAPDVRQRFAWGNCAFLASPALQMSQTVIDAVT